MLVAVPDCGICWRISCFLWVVSNFVAAGIFSCEVSPVYAAINAGVPLPSSMEPMFIPKKLPCIGFPDRAASEVRLQFLTPKKGAAPAVQNEFILANFW